MSQKRNIDELVSEATNNYTQIVSVNEIKEKFPELFWGGNGVGDRFANKKYNYTCIKKKERTLYSENDEDIIPPEVLNDFLENNKGIKSQGIIGIFVHSKKINNGSRPIKKDIHKIIIGSSCVVCGTHSTVCDHKNDLYNDDRVLNTKTQVLSDFQPLCNHCNLQKRQICKKEEQEQKLYSAKNIPIYKVYPFEFPWEKKVFDRNDIYCKNGTFWFDPVEFNYNITCYSQYVIPIVNEIKRRIKTKKLKVLD
jgi:5-methylcytosine-specific restriction endonuclease McrA